MDEFTNGLPLVDGHKYKIIEQDPSQYNQEIQSGDDLGILSAMFSDAKWCYFFDLTDGCLLFDDGKLWIQPLSQDMIHKLLMRDDFESFEPFVSNTNDGD